MRQQFLIRWCMRSRARVHACGQHLLEVCLWYASLDYQVKFARHVTTGNCLHMQHRGCQAMWMPRTSISAVTTAHSWSTPACPGVVISFVCCPSQEHLKRLALSHPPSHLVCMFKSCNIGRCRRGEQWHSGLLLACTAFGSALPSTQVLQMALHDIGVAPQMHELQDGTRKLATAGCLRCSCGDLRMVSPQLP